MSLLGGVVNNVVVPILGGGGGTTEDVTPEVNTPEETEPVVDTVEEILNDLTSGDAVEDAVDAGSDAVNDVANVLGITVDVDVQLGDSGGSLSFGHGGGTSIDSSAVKYDFTGEDEKDFIVDSERAYAIAQQSTFMNRNMIDGLAAHTDQLGTGDAFGLEAAMAGVEQASPLEQYRESQVEASAE